MENCQSSALKPITSPHCSSISLSGRRLPGCLPPMSPPTGISDLYNSPLLQCSWTQPRDLFLRNRKQQKSEQPAWNYALLSMNWGGCRWSLVRQTSIGYRRPKH